jgi:predicted metalloprotease with PDZ domain
MAKDKEDELLVDRSTRQNDLTLDRQKDPQADLRTTPWQFVVSMPQPDTHLFHVQLTVDRWQGDYLEVRLPVWTPGSYLVREYAKHLQDFQAADRQGKPLAWQKLEKNRWRIESSDRIAISYKIFANELTVRTNHLDRTHGYFNGAATFLFVQGYAQQPSIVKIVPPHPDWAVATALPPVAGEPYTYYAADFDTLVDSPFEVGIHKQYDFTVLGKPHSLVIWGEGNPDPQRIIQDTTAIITAEAELFGGLPYDRYMFLLHLSASGNGGLEHKNCCCLNYQRLGFRQDRYLRFLNLVAHEFFHTWNVKRIRPKALETFDYDRESYTPSLWFCEGTTSYYDLLVPLRAGIYDAKHFLKLMSDNITRLQTTYGRHVQPLSESSLDAWIKLYRPDANSTNNQISYYLKGELVSMLLDLAIRQQTQNRASLDDVMRLMWERFGKDEIGFAEAELQEAIASVAGTNLQPFWQAYLHDTQELDYNFYLEPFGLEVQPAPTQDLPPYTGMILKPGNGISTVKSVESNSPAQLAGIDPGDELLAINGVRVATDTLNDRLRQFEPGTSIELTLFKQDLVYQTNLELQAPVSDRYNLIPVTKPSARQSENLQAWLGVSL